MRCCVPFCKTTAEIVSESKDITFHRFPREVHLCAAWLRALGKQDNLLPAGAVVCSQHFLDDEIHETESGSRQIRTGVVPATVLICLICLDTRNKLLPMSEHKLEQAYQHLVGHPPCGGGRLKRVLCVLCAQRLVDFNTFRDESLRARCLLTEMLHTHEVITRRHVALLSRYKHPLPSDIDPDHSDVHTALDAAATNATDVTVAVKREDADTVACAYNERDYCNALEDAPSAAEPEAETQAPMNREHTCKPESSEDSYQLASVNLGVVTTGMSTAWSSPVLVKLRNETESPLARPITENEGSWIVSGGFLIALFGNLIGGMLLDGIGRKYCFLLISLPKLLMTMLLIFATEVWMLILARAIMLASDTFLFIAAPIYASEIASKEHRGSLGTFMQIFSSLGILVSLSIGPFLSYTAFNIVLACAVAASTVPVFFMPESPSHLYSKGRTEEALEVLLKIRSSEAIAKQELQEYQDSQTKSEKIDKAQLFKDRTFLKSLALGFLLFAGCQLTGFNAIQFYLQTILESSNTSVKPEIASVIIGGMQVFASFCTPFFMTKCGRRPVLICSLSGMCLGMLGLGTFFKLTEIGSEIKGILNFLPIVSLILVVYCFSAGIGSLVWLVTAEVFDGPARALGVSITSVSCIMSIFITTKYFALMTSALGPAVTYWFFSGVCMLACVLIALFVPETKGKTFGEIQRDLGRESTKY